MEKGHYKYDGIKYCTNKDLSVPGGCRVTPQAAGGTSSSTTGVLPCQDGLECCWDGLEAPGCRWEGALTPNTHFSSSRMGAGSHSPGLPFHPAFPTQQEGFEHPQEPGAAARPEQGYSPPSGIFHPLSLFQRVWILTPLQSCAQIPQAKPQLLSPIGQRWEMPN